MFGCSGSSARWPSSTRALIRGSVRAWVRNAVLKESASGADVVIWT